MARETSAGGLVLRTGKGGALELAVIRPRGKSIWALPKGHVDPGETPEQAARREVLEETGLVANLEREVGLIEYAYQLRGRRIFKSVYFYLFRYESGEIGRIAPEMEVEVSDARWVPLANAPRLLAYRGERSMAVKAIEMLGLTRADVPLAAAAGAASAAK